LNDIINFVKQFDFPKVSSREQTFFDIGTRGHFENPMTDILSFYLCPHNGHGLGTVVLETFLLQANLVHLDITSRIRVHTQFNRIDLIVEGEDWVIAVENKIWAIVNNPLSSYEAEVSRHFSGKSPNYYILAPDKKSQGNWKWLNTRGLFEELEKLSILNEDQSNKWTIFLKDFVKNILNVTLSEKGFSMNEKDSQRIAHNLEQLKQARDLYDSYHQQIGYKLLGVIKEILPTIDAKGAREQDWKKLGRAVRFKLFSNENYDITFLTIPAVHENASDKRLGDKYCVQYHIVFPNSNPQKNKDLGCAENFKYLDKPEEGGKLLWFWAGTSDYANAIDLVREAAEFIGKYMRSLTVTA
jgi:hypothetical protein